MKTLVKNNSPARQKTRDERRKMNKAAQPAKAVKTPSQEAFILKQSDYQELIEIKEARSKLTEGRRSMFFFLGMSVTLAALILLFNWKSYDAGIVDDLGTLQSASFEELIEPPNTDQPPPPPPKVIQQAVIVEVPDEEILEEVNIEIDVEVTEDMVVQQVIFDEVIEEEEEAEEIFQIVEHNPEPVGGYSAFYKYVSENIKYPSTARRMSIQGKVFVKFVVDKNGNIKDVAAVKGIGGGCDEEAVRIIENSPQWTPGKQRGKSVNVYMMLPITFMLKE